MDKHFWVNEQFISLRFVFHSYSRVQFPSFFARRENHQHNAQIELSDNETVIKCIMHMHGGRTRAVFSSCSSQHKHRTQSSRKTFRQFFENFGHFAGVTTWSNELATLCGVRSRLREAKVQVNARKWSYEKTTIQTKICAQSHVCLSPQRFYMQKRTNKSNSSYQRFYLCFVFFLLLDARKGCIVHSHRWLGMH